MGETACSDRRGWPNLQGSRQCLVEVLGIAAAACQSRLVPCAGGPGGKVIVSALSSRTARSSPRSRSRRSRQECRSILGTMAASCVVVQRERSRMRQSEAGPNAAIAPAAGSGNSLEWPRGAMFSGGWSGFGPSGSEAGPGSSRGKSCCIDLEGVLPCLWFRGRPGMFATRVAEHRALVEGVSMT
jgi:hypothetical protein